MKRAIKWICGLLLAGVVLFAGLILLLPMIIDPNDYKDKISDLVYDSSGYKIEIPGDIGLHVSPRLDVLFSLGQVLVHSGPDFPEVTLLSSEEARVELSLLPLLREKKLVIQRLQLHGGYCHLIRNKAGKGNWELPGDPATSPPTGQDNASDSAPQAAGKETKVPALELEGLEFSKINVRYEDQQTDKRFELKDFSIHAGHVQDGQPFHLQSGFTLTSSGSHNSVLSVVNELETDVTLALAAGTIQLDNLSLVSLIKGFGLQESEVTLAASAFIDYAGKNAKLEDVTLRSRDLAIMLKAEIMNFADPVFSGSLQIPEFSPGKFLEQNKLSQPAWKDESALQQLGFSCEFQGDRNKITVSAIQAIFDGAHANGDFVLTDLKQPAYDFQLHLDRLDLDRYAVAPQQAEAAVAAEENNTGDKVAAKTADNGAARASSKAASLQPLFPVELLRGLQFHLDLMVDSMKISGAELTKVTLKAEGKDGLLALKPFQANLYDGSIMLESTLDVRGKTPKLAIKQELDHVQVGPLLHDLTGKEEVTGAAVFSLQVDTSGNSQKQLMRQANGKMNLALENGLIKKLHILQVIRQAKALYDGEVVVRNAEDEPTGFARISVSGVIKEGVLYSHDLKASSDLMNVSGSGTVDLGEEYVDYLLKISLLRGMDRNNKSGKTDYSKFVIPYKIHGTFSGLKQEADVVGLFKSEVKSYLMDEIQKQLDKDDGDAKQGEKKDPVKSLLDQGLKSLFGK
ncbi:MAG: AsmA family protein [Thermodesulfobacteriota bacterium]|nr:AsmA family protein [Thermodesulfobacteriota bacterium]